MAGRDDLDTNPTRKLGRGLSEVSHLFISGKDRLPAGEARAAADARAAGPEAPGAPTREPASARSLGGPADALAPEHSAIWRPSTTLIAITSGEGVRGKSFLAANLAFGLLSRGRRPAVVNADLAKPDVLDILASSRPDAREAVGVAGGAYGSIPTADAVPRLDPAWSNAPAAWPPQAGGPPPPVAAVNPLAAIEAVARAGQSVIIDIPCSAEFGPLVWQMANLTIVLAEPDPEKIKASYLAIKRVQRASGAARIGLAINLVQSYAEGEEWFRKLAEISRKFLRINLRNYGYILEDAVVGEALIRAVPLAKAFPDSIAARCIDSILGLIMMDESAIAKRRKEVTLTGCASRRGRLEVLRS
ncbi:MAG TPA: hypothetical protein VMU02_08540 [bacterium]|nr:hypothetical protein [bacterium]